MQPASIRYFIALTVFYCALCGGLLYLAGSFDLPFFYAVFGCQILIGDLGTFLLSPELIAERIKPKGKDKDPIGTPLIATLWLSQLSLAALDVGHWHVASNVPFIVQLIAFVLMTAAWSCVLWSMVANMYFSSAIRLQGDRGQKVVAGGPYAWMRHPGYAFSSIGFLTEGIALGSWLTIMPTMLIVSHLLFRTILEERMLQPGLPGYAEYAAKVPFKWVPGIW